MKPIILVPTDFTEAADKALIHAKFTAKKAGGSVKLVHFHKGEKEQKIAEKAIQEQALLGDSEVEVQIIIKEGDFKDVPDIAREEEADLIFMGTHGAKGMQKVFGSNALKLVTHSQIPFVIVQKDSVLDNGYDKILVTASSNSENKQKIKAVAIIASYFNSDIIIQYREEKDENLRINTATNLVFMKRYLDEKGIQYSVDLSNGKDFNDDTLALAKKRDAKLIAIVNVQMNTILGTGLLGPNYEQELITNELNVPIMIISPSQNTRSGSVFAL